MDNIHNAIKAKIKITLLEQKPPEEQPSQPTPSQPTPSQPPAEQPTPSQPTPSQPPAEQPTPSQPQKAGVSMEMVASIIALVIIIIGLAYYFKKK